MNKQAQLTAIFGARGSGKSTLARRLIGSAERVIFFDPIGDHARELGIPQARGLDRLAERMRGRASFRLAFHPPPGREIEALDHLSRLVLDRVQKPYFEGRSAREILLVVEEINLAYCAPLDPDWPSFTRVCLQGRHYGVNVIGITQRPKLVHPNFRDNAAETYILRLEGADDRQAVISRIGREHAETINRLGDHEWIRVHKGQVEQGRNPPIK
jgi:DNA helicase HerA-like ATPase